MRSSLPDVSCAAPVLRIAAWLLVAAWAALPCTAQTAAAVQRSARVLSPVDGGKSTRLSGHVPVFADTDRLPSAALPPRASFSHLTMVLSRAPEVEAAFEQLMADQVNPASSRYHQWLTPAQVGTLYGPAQADVEAVTNWLQSQGLTVDSVSPNRLFVDFSGPASSVESAFGTSFRLFSLANGEQRYSLTQEPAVPAALQPVVATVAGLSEVIHHATAHKGELITPKADAGSAAPALNSASGNHYLVSGDFAVAYDINPAYSAGINGAGQNIAVAGEARVNPADISALEALEGLAAKQANLIIPSNGVDPGAALTTSGSDNGAQDEATLDVDRTIGTAPGATVDLVVSGNIGNGNTYATDGLYIAINYAISTLNDPILSISFSGCEYLNGQANDLYEQSMFQTAAAQGISTFISSGDSGAAACNAFSSTIPSGQVLSINDFCANQYVTCLGGTEFADSSNASAYWSSTSGTGRVTLLSYIPEGAWNDVAVSSSGTYSQGATGGGISVYLPKPSWQTGTGIPAGSFRWIPDIALSSSTHDGYVTCLAYEGATCGSFFAFGGTSAAAPSMAGIQALVNQKLGGRQGNINPSLYALASSSSPAFHDVTVATSGVGTCTGSPSLCNNSTPTSASLSGGLVGYLVNAGWDASTGWGSLDVTNYLTALSTPTFTVSPSANTLNLSASTGATVSETIQVTSIDTYAGTAALTCTVSTASGSAAGMCALSSPAVTLTAGSTATATLTITNTGGTSTGALSVVVKGAGTTTATAPAITVYVATPSFTLTAAASSLSFTSGAATGNATAVTLTSVSGFSGQVNFSCSLTSSSAYYAPSCSVSPATAAVIAGGQVATEVFISSTKAVAAAASGGQAAGLSRRWRFGGEATLAMLVLCLPLYRKRKLPVLAASLVAFLGISVISGCGSGGSAAASTPVSTTTTHSSAGTYTLTVTGTSAANAAITASSTLTVTIN